MQHDSLSSGGLLSAKDATAVRQAGAVVIVTDYWIARRQRVHLLWDAETDQQWEYRDLDELLTTAQEQRFRLALVVPGTRRRPRLKWWITIIPDPTSRTAK